MQHLEPHILSITKSEAIIGTEKIQALWNNYGSIYRVFLSGSSPSSVVVKHIQFHNQREHPQGWNTKVSHQRKVESYGIENHWYTEYAQQCKEDCKVPRCLGFMELSANEKMLVLEDLNAQGYNLRAEKLSIAETKIVVKWLANFHAQFMHRSPHGLWSKGTYWHLSTRKDEYQVMADGWLKQNAKKIDERLDACQHQTLVHGDAKIANFCFSKDMQKVAAVDFQYVGGGCGMKDLVYFLGSCLSAESCEKAESDLLEQYFFELRAALKTHHPKLDAKAIEKEYRALYALAWTDFTRFLLGWNPNHTKLNAYSQILLDRVQRNF